MNQISTMVWAQTLYNSSNIAFLVSNAQRHIVSVNSAACTFLGYSEKELLGKSSRIIHVSNKSMDDFITYIEAVKRGEYIDEIVFFRHKDGHIIYGRIGADYIEKSDEILWSLIDVNKRVQIEKELREKKYQLNVAQKLLKMASWQYDLKSGQISASDEVYTLLHLDKNEPLTFEKFIAMIHPEDRALMLNNTKILLESGRTEGAIVRVYVEVRDGVKELRYFKSKGMALFDANGKPYGTIGAILDVTNQKLLELELKEKNRLLEHQAYYDALTGLANRSLLMDRMQQKFAHADRHNTKVAVLFIDLDDFKSINDSLGHEAGDLYLQKLATIMQERVRRSDTLARLGGDEFVILLDDIEDSDTIIHIIDEGMQAISKPIKVHEQDIYPNMSIGVALYPDDAHDATTILRNADAAMYEAKKRGKHTYSFYNEAMTSAAYEKLSLEADLRKSIENSELRLYGQPQINAQKMYCSGFESLIRWEHPTLGLIPPFKFIPLAEEIGFIVTLDRWVMQESIKWLAQLYKKGLNPGVVALNIAVQELEQEDFVDFIQSIIKKYDAQASWIEIEVTEGGIMKNPEKSIAKLQEISDMGIKLAIDDFGTGYSSLAYLKRLPVDKLKIDKSFVDGLPDDEEDATISRVVIALAKSMQFEIIAEGVETKEQLDFLLQEGCDNIQGYYFAKPMPIEEFEAFLQKPL